MRLVELVRPVAREQHQVLGSVVQRIVVDVMNSFRPSKWSAYRLRHYQTMLHHISVLASHRLKFRWTPHVPHAYVVAMLGSVRQSFAP